MKLFNLSKAQEAELLKLITETANKMVMTEFSDPEKDQPKIRQLAYLRGKLDAFSSVMRDDFDAPDLEPTQESEDGNV